MRKTYSNLTCEMKRDKTHVRDINKACGPVHAIPNILKYQ